MATSNMVSSNALDVFLHQLAKQYHFDKFVAHNSPTTVSMKLEAERNGYHVLINVLLPIDPTIPELQKVLERAAKDLDKGLTAQGQPPESALIFQANKTWRTDELDLRYKAIESLEDLFTLLDRAKAEGQQIHKIIITREQRSVLDQEIIGQHGNNVPAQFAGFQVEVKPQ